jgi:ABC-2 type transport system ATP-binding protein
VSNGPSILPELAGRLAANHLEVADLALRRPTLDDVFLTLTRTPRSRSRTPQ